MTPAILREALFRAGNRVALETFLHGRKPAEVATLRESMADLVEWGLAIDHGDAWQAVRGSGKAVATAQHVKVVKEGQRPLGVLPRMSERHMEGGLESGRRKYNALTARIDILVERLREGAPRKLLKGLSDQDLYRYKKTRPADYLRIVEALEAGRAREVAA